MSPDHEIVTRRARGAAAALRSALVAFIIAVCTAAAAHAQRTPLLEYSTPTGSVQAMLGARFDVTGYAPQSEPAWLIRETKPFVVPGASLFGEAFLGASVYLLGELRADGGAAPAAGELDVRIEQLFARYSVAPALELQAGRFVSPFGSYPQRHGSVSDPLIRPPLPYDWPTVAAPAFVAGANNGFLTWKDDPATFRPRGAPPVWGVPYQVGVMAFGTFSSASYRLAIMNSAPSSVPSEWNGIEELWQRPSFVAALAWQFTPALRAGASLDHGPWMQEELTGGAYAGATESDDYMQTIAGIEASYARDRIEFRGELFFDRWEVPVVIGTPVDISWYVESRMKAGSGAFAALRFAQIHFNSIPRAAGPGEAEGAEERWDYPVTRIQLGGGYPFSRTIRVLAEYQWTLQEQPRDLNDNLLSLQVRIDP